MCMTMMTGIQEKTNLYKQLLKQKCEVDIIYYLTEMINGFFPVDGKSLLGFGLEFLKGRTYSFDLLTGVLGKLWKYLKR